MNKRTFLMLGWATLLGFGFIGFLLIKFWNEQSFVEVLRGSSSMLRQLIVGTLYGLLTSMLAWRILAFPFFKKSREKYTKLIGSFQLGTKEIIFISCCAGIGEELLFRGGLQPKLGIWLTSVIFVAIHGYYNPKNISLSIYAVYLTFVIAGMGYLSAHLGIVTAIIAHTVVDVVLLMAMNRDSQFVGNDLASNKQDFSGEGKHSEE